MCAINGIVHFGGSVDKHELNKRIRTMQLLTEHRGPDGSDTLLFENAAIGMNRLSIVAPLSGINLRSDSSGKHALLNGEIVNHKSLRSMIRKNTELDSCDISVILPMFNDLGQDFIKEFAGMFSIAIYDEVDNKLQLWRDPLGIKPLYYYQSNDSVIFSSEIKAIYAVMKKSPEPDFAALDHILRYRFQPGESTVFPEIKRVLPGETVIFQDGKIQKRRYWELKSNSSFKDKTTSIDDFRELLSKVVSENVKSDVNGGFFTSGGLDSSLITSMGLKAKDSSFKQPISLKFAPTPTADEYYGKKLENYLQKPFEWVTVSDEDARDNLSELIKYLDEPLENPIHVGTYMMAKRANELGLKSVLVGDGSDEFFLGYERHACWFNSTDPVYEYPKHHWTMKPEEGNELYTLEAASQASPIVDGYGKNIEPFLSMDQALVYERSERLPEYHNMRLDRMTMALGVEARVPFLDHRIVEYSLKVPTKQLFGAHGKEWLQKVSEPWLPREIIRRPKVLFPSLPDQWISGNGINWASEILLDNSAHSKKWIERSVLERYLKEHQKGIKQRGKLLWALTVMELWLYNLSNWKDQAAGRMESSTIEIKSSSMERIK